ncbi:MAG: TRZ/ATZ family hydrolase [Gammaproteobacteria bacterium]|nr:MAG: TRZ/ATZ family hydrolase [Gammaproteobacteria bacterium]
MENICTLIEAKWLIPVVPSNTALENHALAVSDGKIIDILPRDAAQKKYNPERYISLADHALIPGLINTHTHAAMALLKGFADDLPLNEWLNNHIWPAEGKFVSNDFVYDGASIAIAEMIKSGTTTLNDMYFFPSATAKAAEDAGIRACVGIIALEFPSAYAQNFDDYIEKGIRVHNKYKTHELISTMFAPHAPYTVSPEGLAKISQLAHDMDLQIQMHIHETTFEVEQSKTETGKSPLANLNHAEFLNSNLLAVHMTQLTDAEIALISKKGISVVHCPESNLKLASGFCPISKLIEANVNVCLGTDGSASNNDLDMLGEMRTAALIAKGVSGKADAVPAHTALEIATINGAKALGLADKIGSLEIGKQADITAIDLSKIESAPVYEPISQIVYATTREQITNVWVAGKQLLDNRKLTTLNEPELISRANEWKLKISAA